MSMPKVFAILAGPLIALLLWGQVAASLGSPPLVSNRVAPALVGTPRNPLPTSTPTPIPTRRRITLPGPVGTLVNVEPLVTPTPTRKPRIVETLVAPNSGVFAPDCGNQAAVARSPVVEVWSRPNIPLQVSVAMQNTGSCTWGPSYTLSFEQKDAIGANPLNIPAWPTAPQAIAPFVVNLMAPAGGSHVGMWAMKAPDGTWFGPVVTIVVYVTQ
jgi:hypothetical protein